MTPDTDNSQIIKRHNYLYIHGKIHFTLPPHQFLLHQYPIRLRLPVAGGTAPTDRRGKMAIARERQRQMDRAESRLSTRPELNIASRVGRDSRLDPHPMHGDKILAGRSAHREDERHGLLEKFLLCHQIEMQLTVYSGDGVEAIYKPWIKENYYAHQGQLELRILSDCTPESAERLLSGFEKFGVEATFASQADAEYMYLLKQAYILSEDSTPAWKKIIKSLDTQNASKAERVKALRQYWSDKLGVKDVTQIPGYDPNGKYSLMSSAWKNKKEAGYRHQLRFDITDEQVKRELGDYGLYHRLTNGSDIATVLDQILDHNGALISTVEKMRVGIPVGGMSPSSDMGTGGGSYFFTRIRKLPGVGYKRGETGFYFKPHLLRRMDAITYEGDKYGRVTGNHVRQHRKVNINDYRSIASRKSSNETIFKNEVTLLDNLQLVTVSNETAKRKVLNVFRKHGVTQLPDGRQVRD
ncbi:MAG: hypothetical protein P9X24_04765 [Candidatus Hatepunaea meridiana]|nr:hypothetical protein [Candidatus Hatepunaea meridiana]